MPVIPDPKRIAELRKEHGVYGAVHMAKREARIATLAGLSRRIENLPASTDSDLDLIDVLRAIVDLLEG